MFVKPMFELDFSKFFQYKTEKKSLLNEPIACQKLSTSFQSSDKVDVKL